MDSTSLLELDLGCSRAVCCSPVCVYSCTVREIVSTQLRVCYAYLQVSLYWSLLWWFFYVLTVGVACYFSSSIIHEKENQSTVISTRSCLDSCGLFSRCMTFTSPTSLPHLNSPSTVMSSFLFFLGLVRVSCLKDDWGRRTNCLLD